MNPFQLQFDLARQWMGFAANAMAAAGAAFQSIGQHTASAVGQPAAPALPAMPMMPWMFNPWQSMPFATPFPTQMPMPFSGMAPTNPFGFANPWSQWLGSAGFPGANNHFGNPWMMPWAAVATFAGPMAMAFFGRPAGGTLMDQVASNYRSASGFATAAIIQPFDPRSYGAGWWPMGGSRGVH